MAKKTVAHQPTLLCWSWVNYFFRRRGCEAGQEGLSFLLAAPHCTHSFNNNRKETLCPDSTPSFFKPEQSSLAHGLLCRDSLSQLCPGRFIIVFLNFGLSFDPLHSQLELKNLQQKKEHLYCASFTTSRFFSVCLSLLVEVLFLQNRLN